MKETLVTRISRIITGTANSIVDAIEGAAPETVMEQAIRDVSDVIAEVRDELGRTEAHKHLLVKSMADLNAKHNTFAEQLETAIGENRDDLAEAVIAKQLDIEAQLPLLEQTLRNTQEQEAELDQAIVALQAKKREMEEDVRRFRDSRQTSGGIDAMQSSRGENRIDKAERAESAFSRVHQRATGISRAAAAIDLNDASQLAELHDLHRRHLIKERLEHAKLSRRNGD